jgi:hypothetical protein
MINGQIRSVVPWSRILDTEEVVLAINTDFDVPRTGWVTIDNKLHTSGDTLTCVYSTDATLTGTKAAIEARNGLSVSITVPAAGFVIFQ